MWGEYNSRMMHEQSKDVTYRSNTNDRTNVKHTHTHTELSEWTYIRIFVSHAGCIAVPMPCNPLCQNISHIKCQHAFQHTYQNNYPQICRSNCQYVYQHMSEGETMWILMQFFLQRPLVNNSWLFASYSATSDFWQLWHLQPFLLWLHPIHLSQHASNIFACVITHVVFSSTTHVSHHDRCDPTKVNPDPNNQSFSLGFITTMKRF